LKNWVLGREACIQRILFLWADDIALLASRAPTEGWSWHIRASIFSTGGNDYAGCVAAAEKRFSYTRLWSKVELCIGRLILG
jgi:hypothetical protein